MVDVRLVLSIAFWDRDDLLEDAIDIFDHICSFYKELFMAGPRSGILLAADFWPVRAMVSANENVELTHPFSSEEVGKAIRGNEV
jgi:hypothetical protein